VRVGLNQFCRSALWSPAAWSMEPRVVRCAQFWDTANRPYDETPLSPSGPAFNSKSMSG
jgi:hypothetical protein